MNCKFDYGFLWFLLVVVVSAIKKKDVKCGKQMVPNGRIVGGKDAYDGEFPFMVSLRYKQHHKCGGAILKSRWVLTAGHCVKSVKRIKLIVRVGEYDLSKDEMNHPKSDHQIKKIFLHPSENDIALLKLVEPIVYDNYAWPICLPDHEEDFSGYDGTIMGWGAQKENGTGSDVLQKAQVPIISRTLCEDMFKRANYTKQLEEGYICAGYEEGKTDSCQGDSGGPLVVKKEGYFTVVGIVSSGNGCARPLLPGVYTSVPYYVPWIHEILDKF